MKVSKEVQRYQNFHNEVEERLKKLQSDNRHITTAFHTTFDKARFVKQHRSYFNSLALSKLSEASEAEEFITYEVNTSSEISSPQSFYDFLDAVNKSDWIVSIEFPINFKRDGEIIESHFKMKVYGINKKANLTKREVE